MKLSTFFLLAVAAMVGIAKPAMATTLSMTVKTSIPADGVTETIADGTTIEETGVAIAEKMMSADEGGRRKLRVQDHRKLYTINLIEFEVVGPTVKPCLGTILFTEDGNCIETVITYFFQVFDFDAADVLSFENNTPNAPDNTLVLSPEDEAILLGLVGNLITDRGCEVLSTCDAAAQSVLTVVVTAETGIDPHFKTFSGDWFDFHGGCDILLIDVPEYSNQAGLAVSIRTTVRYAYSFIETLAIKVGEDVLQVLGWGDYILNGISNADLEGATLNGLPVTREVISEKQYKFVVTLANGHHFTIKVFKDMISTSFDLPQEHDIRGILGDNSGARLARDGVTIMEDANEFGQEWQIQDTDNQLFLTVREPQFPTKCIMPDPVQREKRRLSATVSQEAAEAACSHIKDEHVRDMCIFDVISVDDLSLAAGAY